MDWLIDWLFEFFPNLFDYSRFMARGGPDWNEDLVMMQLSFNSAIFLSHMVISVWLICIKNRLPLSKFWWIFAAFVFWCGITYLSDICMFYYPMYRFDSLLRGVTAVFSVTTSFLLVSVARVLRTPIIVEEDRQ